MSRDPELDKAVDMLMATFPHGHREFIPQLIDLMQLHSEKNAEYAKDGDALGNFNRVSKILALYEGINPADPAIVAVTYMLKQFDAYMWMKAKGYDGKVESRQTRMRDVEVYAGLIRLIEGDMAKHVEGEIRTRTAEQRDKYVVMLDKLAEAKECKGGVVYGPAPGCRV